MTASSKTQQSKSTSSIKLPRGFRFAGVACGIKKSGSPDLAIIASDQPCVAAGVYTQNVVRAASIDWNSNITPTNQFRALVINSGNANACTGGQGVGDNSLMADEVATALNIDNNRQVGVLSTGVIGHLLPINNITKGIHAAAAALGNSSANFDDAATAILTTDKSSKTQCVSVEIGGREIRIAGMAKGAGMIGPNMATMLAVVMTDASIEPDTAQHVLKRVADRSFNRISVEGHTSTNDALMLLCSGNSDTDPVNGEGAAASGSMSGDDLQIFENAVTQLCVDLAKQIPADGEGASHLISISVSGTTSDNDAETIARSIAQSALVKTAVTGNDPNWGRIVSAAGYCGVQFVPNDVSLKINGHKLFASGVPLKFDAATVSSSMQSSFETLVELSVGTGSGSAVHWTSDLTVEYVRFNSEYHT